MRGTDPLTRHEGNRPERAHANPPHIDPNTDEETS
jgi:hypothetical protein